MTEDIGTETEQSQVEATPAGDQQTEDQGRFTQEDLERKIGARLARQERQFEERLDSVFEERLAQWRDENGITDEALERLDQRPEVERQVSTIKGKLTSAEKKLAAATAEAGRMRAHLLDTTGRSAVMSAALEAGSVDPESVFLHVSASGRLTVDQDSFKPVILDANGDPGPDTTIKDLVQKTLDARPNLAKPRGTSGAGSRPGTAGAAPEPDAKALGTPGGLKAALRSKLRSVEG